MPLDVGSHINAELSGALVMEAKPQCKGRPAAAGRELQRLVMCYPKKQPFSSAFTIAKNSSMDRDSGSGVYECHFRSLRIQ